MVHDKKSSSNLTLRLSHRKDQDIFNALAMLPEGSINRFVKEAIREKIASDAFKEARMEREYEELMEIDPEAYAEAAFNRIVSRSKGY